MQTGISSTRWWRRILAFLVPALALPVAPLRADSDPPDAAGKTFTLHLRSRSETAPGSGRYHTLTRTVPWDAAKTAVIICDMWDDHWCNGAAQRVAELAGRMNAVVQQARAQGAFIIHAPSSTVAFYKDTPQRQRAQKAPFTRTPVPLSTDRRWGTGWCWPDPSREGLLPIDDADMGCACRTKCPLREPWTRQIATLQIHEADAITDDGQETYNLLAARGIDNVILMGVHLNMCVLGRPFAIRQLVQLGKNVVLMRDLTDTMYNPERPPYVHHGTGTDLVVEHIEKYWCPTITSADLLGGKEFRFREDRRLHLAIVSAEDEYRTERTLPEFALRHLGRYFRVSYVFADTRDRHHLPGLDVLRDADVALLSIRRRPLPQAQMEIVRQFVASGKPLVAIRTTSHAFAPRGSEKLPEGISAWPDFDRAILGCHYQGHHSSQAKTQVQIAAGAEQHPILQGVRTSAFQPASSLYRSRPLADGAVPLLLGRTDEAPAQEPVAWIYQRKDGGRVFYTSLGHVGDFQQETFVRLLRNGTLWAAGLTIAKD